MEIEQIISNLLEGRQCNEGAKFNKSKRQEEVL